MPNVLLIIESIAIAAGVAAAIISIGGRPWKSPRERVLAATWPLALGSGFFAGCWILAEKLPKWPPSEDGDRLLWLILPAAIAAELLAAIVLRPRWIGWAARLLVAATAGRVLLHNTSYIADLGGGTSDWTAGQTWLILGLMAAGLAVVWLLLNLLAARSKSRSIPLALAMTACAAGVTIMLSGYATGGQRAIPLAAAVAAAAIASLAVPREKNDFRGGLGVAIVALFALVTAGRFFGNLTTAHGVLLFAAPLACWVAEAPFLSGLKTWMRCAIRFAAVAIPLAVVVVQAQQKFAADSRNSGSTDDPYAAYK